METKEYIVAIFNKNLLFRMSILQTINRPNNPEDYEIIEAYIEYNYGNCEFDYLSAEPHNRVMFDINDINAQIECGINYVVIDEDWNIEAHY